MPRLSFPTQRLFDSRLNTSIKERLLSRFQQQQLPFRTRLEIHATRLVVTFVRRPLFGETVIEQNHQRIALLAQSAGDDLLAQLPDTFTRQDAINVRLKAEKSADGTGNMLSQWLHRGYILRMTDDSYKKASAEEKK